jgi:hypothetical protein
METVRKNRPVIVFEHGLGAADHYRTAPDDVYDLLADECGLRLFLMADWLRGDGGGLGKDAFREQFYSGANYCFLAAAR